MGKIMILLPDTIYLNRADENEDGIAPAEYNIYFKNIIQPYSEAWDIVVRCQYGVNWGLCWRLTNDTGAEDKFDLEIAVYDAYGVMLAAKKTSVALTQKQKE